MIIPREVVEKWVAAGSSPVDWCEENYTVNQSIAEFTNTLSNIIFFIVPVFCFVTKMWTSYAKHISSGVHILLILYLCIGASSMYFHATLSLLGQWLDEIYIIYSLMFGYAAFMPNEFRPRFFYGVTAYAICTVIALAFTMLWFVNPFFNAFWMFLLTLPVVVMSLIILKVNNNPVIKLMLKVTLFLFCCSLLIWFSDRLMCGMWLSMGIPGIHSAWHVVAGIVSYLVITLFAYWKAKTDNPRVKTSIRYIPGESWGIPYVYCKELHC